MNLQHHFLIAMPALRDPIFPPGFRGVYLRARGRRYEDCINKPLENLQIEGILEKLKVREPRDSIRLDKAVMLGGPLAEDRGYSPYSAVEFRLQHLYIRHAVITTSALLLETLERYLIAPNLPAVTVALGYRLTG